MKWKSLLSLSCALLRFFSSEKNLWCSKTGNNTGRLEDGMIIMKFLLPILLILEQGIFPIRRGVRA